MDVENLCAALPEAMAETVSYWIAGINHGLWLAEIILRLRSHWSTASPPADIVLFTLFNLLFPWNICLVLLRALRPSYFLCRTVHSLLKLSIFHLLFSAGQYNCPRVRLFCMPAIALEIVLQALQSVWLTSTENAKLFSMQYWIITNYIVDNQSMIAWRRYRTG